MIVKLLVQKHENVLITDKNDPTLLNVRTTIHIYHDSKVNLLIIQQKLSNIAGIVGNQYTMKHTSYMANM